MAIDTAAKRKAISGIYTGLVAVGVTPNAAPDEAWRQQAGWGYSGIAVNPPPPPAETVQDKFTLGSKESMGVTPTPTIGGRWGW